MRRCRLAAGRDAAVQPRQPDRPEADEYQRCRPCAARDRRRCAARMWDDKFDSDTTSSGRAKRAGSRIRQTPPDAPVAPDEQDPRMPSRQSAAPQAPDAASQAALPPSPRPPRRRPPRCASRFLIGESGLRLLEWKVTRDAAVAQRLFEVVEGNLHNSVREQLWGSLGTVLAAIAMAEHTGESRWGHLGLGAEPLRPCRDADRRRPWLRRQRLPGGARRGIHRARTARCRRPKQSRVLRTLCDDGALNLDAERGRAAGRALLRHTSAA